MTLPADERKEIRGLCEARSPNLVKVYLALPRLLDELERREGIYSDLLDSHVALIEEANKERDLALSDLRAARDENERMRAVYEAAAYLCALRREQKTLSDLDYDQMDGQIGDAMDAIDAALASKEPRK